VYSFTAGIDGGGPIGDIMLGPDGTIFGTVTRTGSAGPVLTVYRIRSSTFTLLHQFPAASDPSRGGVLMEPATALAQAADGTLYGATAYGGPGGFGTIYKINPDGTGFALVHQFEPADGIDRRFPPRFLLGRDGKLNGSIPLASSPAIGESPRAGALFQISPKGDYSRLHVFGANMGDQVNRDGALPAAPPIQAQDGNYYGTTLCGGSNDTAPCTKPSGTVYKSSWARHPCLLLLLPWTSRPSPSAQRRR